MKLVKNIYKLLALAIVVCVVASCANTNDIETATKGKGNILLRLSYSGTTGSRGIPNGGEHGDGLEPGQHHENDIDKIILFKYNSAEGINAPDNTPVERMAVIGGIGFHPTSSETISTEILLNVKDYNPHLSDHFIVVTNSDIINATTLGELRNYILSQTYSMGLSGRKADYNMFVMSNEGDSEMEFRAGTEDDPHIVNIDIERMASRIDFCIDGSTIQGDERMYVAADGSTNEEVGDVYVSHIRAFNVMQTPSYLIKRLSASVSGKKFYLRDEKAGARYDVDGTPTTLYVDEPMTWRKENYSTLVTDWYRDSRYEQAIAMGDNWFRTQDKVHVGTGDGFTDGTSTDANGWNYYVLDYGNENTAIEQHINGKTATGVMMKSVYKPAKVYSGINSEGELILNSSFAKGQSFWRYRPIVTNYDETQAVYFDNATAANAYKALRVETPGIVEEYTNGKCYYVVYLRHDNSQELYKYAPMEFATVRNNIYRLKVSFTGPGFNHIPDNPELTPEYIRPFIFVRKWYKINHPEIEI